MRRKVVSSANLRLLRLCERYKGQDRHRQVSETRVKVTYRPSITKRLGSAIVVYLLYYICSRSLSVQHVNMNVSRRVLSNSASADSSGALNFD